MFLIGESAENGGNLIQRKYTLLCKKYFSEFYIIFINVKICLISFLLNFYNLNNKMMTFIKCLSIIKVKIKAKKTYLERPRKEE